MEEKEEEGRVLGGGGRTTTTATMMAMDMATDRNGGGGTHAARVRSTRSGSTGEGRGVENDHERDSSSQEDKISPIELKKKRLQRRLQQQGAPPLEFR